mmetsp:Transcript_818/g.1865  ORF Transcript_818/g.1865 Transcript_818/m.1865 type:complete len:309 (+) Transcript_818:102-1028(+)
MVNRDGWGDTLQDELGVRLPDGDGGGRRRTTRADAEKRGRRQKTRRWTAYDGVDSLQRKRESRLERLESTNVGDALLDGDNENDYDGADSDEFINDDDFGSESEDHSGMSDEDSAANVGSASRKTKKKGGNSSGGPGSGHTNSGGGSKRARSKTTKTAKRPKKKQRTAKAVAAAAVSSNSNAGTNSKKQRMAKIKLRSLAEILLDENARKLGEVTSIEELDAPDYINAKAGPPRYPSRKLCAVTGVPAPYKDPESSLYYAHARAFEQLREQPPPWVRASATAPFHESMRIIAEERARVRKKIIKSTHR